MSAKPKCVPVAAGAKCRVCGCTQHDCRGCIERTGSACWWVERDLCSACTGIALINQERARQVSEEGWTAEHDDKHTKGELRAAGECYLYSLNGPDRVPVKWPWDRSWWKPSTTDAVRNLVKAGALFVAESERLKRRGVQRGQYVLQDLTCKCAQRIDAVQSRKGGASC